MLQRRASTRPVGRARHLCVVAFATTALTQTVFSHGAHAQAPPPPTAAGALPGTSAAELNPAYLGYIGAVPAEALAVVNLMSLFGLHRAYRGAVVGHFAATEITSSPGSRRILDALTRMEAPQPCRAFYAEHVSADAVHEQIVRTDVVGDLIDREPALERDVVFGIRAFEALEDRLADHLLRCWVVGDSSLRQPLT